MRVYYSDFFVDGEGTWYNPAMSFFVHGGSGPITGLASMDGRLFIFKGKGIWAVDGDGPGESGPTGSEFSPPTRLATEYGCIDHRSIVVTTEGIVYRSARGIELLTRSLQVVWVGDSVQNTVNTYPYTVGAAYDSFGRVHILLSSAAPAPTVTGATGCELVWDIPGKAWSVHYSTGHAGVYGRAVQDIAVADVGGVETLLYADPALGVAYADPTTGLDGSAQVPWVFESGWIRMSQQVRQRVSNILFLGQKHSNHAMKVSLAYNYVDSYTQSHTWEPDVLNTLAIEELAIKPTVQQVLAIRVKIEELTPSDTGTYPLGTGRGVDLLGLSAEIASLSGAPFANRGTAGVLSLPPAVSGVYPASGSAAGATAVTVYGENLSASTSLYFGGVIATSIVYVDSHTMTCVTPAGSVGVASVLASNSGGTGTLTNGFTYLSGAWTPSLLAATMFYDSNYAGGRWSPSASAGPSIYCRDLIPVVGTPTVGSLNGYPTAIVAGSSASYFQSVVSAGTAFKPSAGGLFVLFRPTSAPATSSPSYTNPLLFGDSSIFIHCTYTTNGVGVAWYDGAYQIIETPAATGAWHLVMVRWDGSTMGVKVDSVAEVTSAMSPIVGVEYYSQVAYRLGQYNGYNSDSFDGAIATILTMDTTPTPTDFANYKAYVNSTYALAL